VTLPPGSVVEVPAISGVADGYTVEGQGALVAAWVTTGEVGTAYSVGVPVLDE
jgi:hypothetical protein